eukprot:gb/GECG01010179.1/.p1 GENE.gb/GECG01010179.1/~~gb/GECG01010179.1/.p1  ORF type:complete len:420 (+),score=42.75 gb/GECG01010179.1/:1-1260(+)
MSTHVNISEGDLYDEKETMSYDFRSVVAMHGFRPLVIRSNYIRYVLGGKNVSQDVLALHGVKDPKSMKWEVKKLILPTVTGSNSPAVVPCPYSTKQIIRILLNISSEHPKNTSWTSKKVAERFGRFSPYPIRTRKKQKIACELNRRERALRSVCTSKGYGCPEYKSCSYFAGEVSEEYFRPPLQKHEAGKPNDRAGGAPKASPSIRNSSSSFCSSSAGDVEENNEPAPPIKRENGESNDRAGAASNACLSQKEERPTSSSSSDSSVYPWDVDEKTDRPPLFKYEAEKADCRARKVSKACPSQMNERPTSSSCSFCAGNLDERTDPGLLSKHDSGNGSDRVRAVSNANLSRKNERSVSSFLTLCEERTAESAVFRDHAFHRIPKRDARCCSPLDSLIEAAAARKRLLHIIRSDTSQTDIG